MSQITQKQAVYAAITSVLAENSINFDSETPVDKVMTRELRSQVNTILVEGFKSGQIQIDRQYESEAALKAYVSGLQSNWIRKDTRLNGGVSYVAKNPGSRQGNSNPQIKAMKALLLTLTTEEDKAEVQAEIDKTLAELNKAKAPKIDFNSLPESLKSKFVK